MKKFIITAVLILFAQTSLAVENPGCKEGKREGSSLRVYMINNGEKKSSTLTPIFPE